MSIVILKFWIWNLAESPHPIDAFKLILYQLFLFLAGYFGPGVTEGQNPVEDRLLRR